MLRASSGAMRRTVPEFGGAARRCGWYAKCAMARMLRARAASRMTAPSLATCCPACVGGCRPPRLAGRGRCGPRFASCAGAVCGNARGGRGAELHRCFLHVWNGADVRGTDELPISNVHLLPGVAGSPAAQLGRQLWQMPSAAEAPAERSGIGMIIRDFNCVEVEEGRLHSPRRRVTCMTWVGPQIACLLEDWAEVVASASIPPMLCTRHSRLVALTTTSAASCLPSRRDKLSRGGVPDTTSGLGTW